MFAGDLTAGLVVGIVALPLSIAFAIASGVTPQQGLYTAVIGGFIISALSGSRVQIGGPTGAFIVLIYEIVHQFGYDGLAVATILAGGLLVALGLARMGGVIQYIPYPVTLGFTAGIAVVIVSGQIRDALGLEMVTLPPDFIPRCVAYADAIGTVNPWAVGITAGTVILLFVLPRFVPRLPPSVVALVAATAVVAWFDLPVETIGSRFGSIPGGLPALRLPQVDFALIPKLISPAISIALLAAIESLLSAVVADGMTGRRHRPNAELVAQGVANIVSPLFGGIPVTGAIARTATNIKNGGRTPVAGMIHALTLAVILVVAGPMAALVPMCVLAGILFVVAYNMSELHLFRRVVQSTTKSDAMVLLSTFLLTVLVGITVALQAGVVLAALLFMRRMVDVSHVRLLHPEDETDPDIGAAEAAALRAVPTGVEIFEVNGPFFFGAAHKFSSALAGIERRPKVLVLRMRNVPTIDATGLRVLDALQTEAERGGPRLVFSGIHSQTRKVMERSGIVARVGTSNVTANLTAALARVGDILADEHNQLKDDEREDK